MTDPKQDKDVLEHDVLEHNVSSLLENGGEPPRIDAAARTRIREALVAKHAAAPVSRSRFRVPLVVGFGLAATAATALVITRTRHHEAAHVGEGSTKLADGSTYITEPGAKVTVLGARRVRVEGAALLDVAPGKGTFVVETARGTIEVLGTRFLVDAEATRTTAAVVRGQVKLASDQGNVLLHAGEQGVAEPGRPPTRGPAPRLSHLVSWAQQARRRDEGGTVEPIRHGSLFARDPGVRPGGQFGQEYPLPITALTVDVVVEDRVARVALDQTFHNPTPRVLEGMYKFAIPPDAALQRLAMYVDGKLTESAVVERMRARRIYEELVYRRVDPALLEYAGTGRLNLRVYPLPANQDKRLMVAYTQSVPKLYSDWTLTVPLPEVDEPVGELTVSARIAGCANCELTAPGLPITVERSGNDAVVKLHRTGTKIGDSFVVHVRDARKDATVATATEGKDRYMLVRAPAELAAAAREYRPRTWVILDDVSASRGALELRAQTDLVDAFLRELDEDDRVSVVAFDVEARTKLAPTRVADVDRRAVRASLKDEGGVGATDVGGALDAAVRALAGVNPDDAMVVYLGDGVITSGARNLDALRAQLVGKAHFVGVGLGDGPDTQTLDALAAATGGFATTIDLADDVGWRAFDLVAALHTSRVTGVSARLVDASGGLLPATVYLRSPQLADGEEIELVAKLASDATPAAVELTGTRGGAAWQQRIALGTPTHEGAAYLPRQWAQQHIAARLLAKHEPVIVPPCAGEPCPTEGQLREQRDEAIRQEVITLGKQYFLLSRHTSLLVLENDAMYAQYGVRKGAGDTWAPYAMPATIPVKAAAAPAPVADDVATDAELVRVPLQLFYPQYSYGGDDLDSALGQPVTRSSVATTGMLGVVGNGQGFGQGFGRSGGGMGGGGAIALDTEARDKDVPAQTRASLGLADAEPAEKAPLPDLDRAEHERFVETKTAKPASPVMGKRGRVSSDELAGGLGSVGLRGHGYLRRTRHFRVAGDRYGATALSPARFNHPADTTFDDLTAIMPALVPDAADGWRLELLDGAGGAPAFPIDDAAKQLLANARSHLASGIYRWGDVELAVDGARRIGWRRTTELGLAETASYDGTSWTRRYAELGISATRPVAEDDLAIALGYLPIWIADPAHYARWFVVSARGPREVALSTKENGKDTLRYTLRFDDDYHLVAITDADGSKLLEVEWGSSGPTRARVLGTSVAVGYTGEAVSDATQWAHGTSQPGVSVELPSRLPAYWTALASKETPGSPAWRRVQRQRMVSAAALGDRAGLVTLYFDLKDSGGVELGDLVLASGGLVTSATDRQLADALAPFATSSVARYLLAGRKFDQSPGTARTPEVREGAIGALWGLRAALSQLGNDYYYDTRSAAFTKTAVDTLLAVGENAPLLRLVGAAVMSQRYNLDAQQVARAWDSVAHGEYANLARAQAATVLYSRGNYDAAAEMVAKLVTELDLEARPARVDVGPYSFNNARRGPAGWQLLLATWRDKVLAGSSFEHVMALAPLTLSRPGDLTALLGRAAALAAGDADRTLAVIQTSINLGQPAFAQTLLAPLLAGTPPAEVLELAASMAQNRGDLEQALTYLERAEDAGADEEVDLNTVRGELRRIIALAQQLALQSTGATRSKAVDRALGWGARWRAIDPGNDEIDRTLGSLLLAMGDAKGAWRQLSSVVERDPWSGAGYAAVAEQLEQQGKVAEALELWQQAIVIDQTNPTHRLRKAQALIALGRGAEGDALLQQIATAKWHDMWSGVVYQAKNLLQQGKSSKSL